MTAVARSEQLVRNIVRLRRAERIPELARDIAAVREDLEAEVGPTLSRSRAARILGVSQTALDRWIASGEVPVVITPTGRREVPRRFVIEMAELIEELRRSGQDRHVLAAALRRRRGDAEALRPRLLDPGPRTRRRHPQGHRTAERRSLAFHRIVADRLSEPLVETGRRRLDKLSEEGRIAPVYARRWREVLSRPIGEIRRVITQDDQEGRDLRQNTPFAGTLNEQERRQIIETVA